MGKTAAGKAADPNNKRWATDKDSFGYQTMARMGWEEGRGLGKDGRGQSTHVRVSKKLNNKGIGSAVASDNWFVAWLEQPCVRQ